MEYSINIKFFEKELGLKQAAKLVAAAGFTQLDYTPYLLNDNWKNKLKEAMEIFSANGLTIHQTHAPFNRYGSYGEHLALCTERCAEATERMGAKFMVVHGDEFDFESHEFSPKAALDYNHNLFLPYVERAARNGYRIAFETVFEENFKRRRRFTSDAGELLSLIRSYESKSAVCCWDFGHAHVAFRKNAPAVIRQFGDLIQCTHLHDNAGNDSHQMPLTGDINWQETTAALKEIPYNGVLSVEYAHGSMPAHLTEDFINLTYKTAKHIWTL